MKGDNSSNLIWKLVKRNLEIDIINGVYESGKKVPSINEVSAKYKIAYKTAKKVLDSMEEDGVLLGKKGSGYFVRPYMGEKLKDDITEELEAELQETIQTASKVLNESFLRNIIEKQIRLHYSTKEKKEVDTCE